MDAEGAEERVLAVGAPAGERDAVDADAGDAEDDEQADVEVGDLEEVDPVNQGECAEGNDGDGDERAAEGDDGRDDEERALDGERHHVFLEEELEAVDEGLQQAEGADARGSPAVLKAAEDFALEQHRVGNGAERDAEYDRDLDDREQKEDFEVGQMSHRVGLQSQSAEVRWSATSVDWWR